MIQICFAKKTRKAPGAWVKRVLYETLKAERAQKKDLSAYITNNSEIRRINKKYLNHDYATDVISFGQEEENFLGDLAVSSQMAEQMAKKLQISFKEELARYLIHGTLHLLGYDDEKPSDCKKMFARQETLLKKILKD